MCRWREGLERSVEAAQTGSAVVLLLFPIRVILGTTQRQDVRISGGLSKLNDPLPLQRHFRVLTKFAHVELRLSGRLRRRGVMFYKLVNPCDRRACSTSVAVGLNALPATESGARYYANQNVKITATMPAKLQVLPRKIRSA